MPLSDVVSHAAGATLLDMMTNNGITMNLGDGTAGRFKVSLWRDTATGTPAEIVEETTQAFYGNTASGHTQFDPDAASNHYNEISDWGAGYTAGGQNLVTPALSCSAGSGKLVWTALGLTWSGANGTNLHTVRGIKIDWCATAGTPSRPFVLHVLDNDYPLDAGTFDVDWDPMGGVFYWVIL